MSKKQKEEINVKYVWSDQKEGIIKVWGSAPIDDADFLLIRKEVFLKHNDPLYKIAVFRGDENGDHKKNGKIYWAYCKKVDCLADGLCEIEAIIACREAIAHKIEIMKSKKIKLPKCPKVKIFK